MSRNSLRKNAAKRQAVARVRERALLERDPSLAAFISFRAWLKQVVARASFKVVFACALFVANTFAWPYLPAPASAASAVGSVTLGALLGAGCDALWRARMKRSGEARDGEDKERNSRVRGGASRPPKIGE